MQKMHEVLLEQLQSGVYFVRAARRASPEREIPSATVRGGFSPIGDRRQGSSSLTNRRKSPYIPR
jgi:hypothetical protein